MRNGRPEGDFGLELAYIVRGKGSKIVEAGMNGPRNLPRAVFEVARKTYSLTYEPGMHRLVGEGVAGRYFPVSVADKIDATLGVKREIDQAGISEGRASRYRWDPIHATDLEKIKVPLRAVRALTPKLK